MANVPAEKWWIMVQCFLCPHQLNHILRSTTLSIINMAEKQTKHQRKKISIHHFLCKHLRLCSKIHLFISFSILPQRSSDLLPADMSVPVCVCVWVCDLADMQYYTTQDDTFHRVHCLTGEGKMSPVWERRPSWLMSGKYLLISHHSLCPRVSNWMKSWQKLVLVEAELSSVLTFRRKFHTLQGYMDHFFVLYIFCIRYYFPIFCFTSLLCEVQCMSSFFIFIYFPACFITWSCRNPLHLCLSSHAVSSQFFSSLLPRILSKLQDYCYWSQDCFLDCSGKLSLMQTLLPWF